MCQLLLTEHDPSNQNLTKSLRVVHKRISLTAQTAGCLPLKCTPRLLFVYFSQLSPPRTFQAHFSVVIFYLISPVLYSFQRNSFKGCSKTRFIYYSNQNTFVTVSFSLGDKSPIINCKFQSLRRQSCVISLCRDTTWVRN